MFFIANTNNHLNIIKYSLIYIVLNCVRFFIALKLPKCNCIIICYYIVNAINFTSIIMLQISRMDIDNQLC